MKLMLVPAIALILVLQSFMAISVKAEAEPSQLLIVELQVKSAGLVNSSSEEFIELCNATENPLDLSSVKLEYKSSTGTSWLQKATLSGMLAPGGKYLLASNNYLTEIAHSHFASGLADSAGHIRITSGEDDQLVVHDLVGWGITADSAEGDNSATNPPAGNSLKRLVDDDGNFIDTNNNAADFVVSNEPTPEADELVIEPPEDDEVVPDPDIITETPDPQIETPNNPPPEEPSTPPPASSNDTANAPPALYPVISELLPNPAPPFSDSTDEFIELFNPSNEPIELDGFKLQSGTNFSYSFTFTDEVIAPGQYLEISSLLSNLVLANGTSKVRLLDPSGNVIDEITPYANAKDGQAWALIGETWQWTLTPTPNTTNLLTLAPLKVPKVAANTTSTKKKTSTAKKTATKKPKVAAKTTSKKSTPAESERAEYEEPPLTPDPLNSSVLAGVSTLAVLYAGYEYRSDLANRFYKLRRYRAARRAARG